MVTLVDKFIFDTVVGNESFKELLDRFITLSIDLGYDAAAIEDGIGVLASKYHRTTSTTDEILHRLEQMVYNNTLPIGKLSEYTPIAIAMCTSCDITTRKFNVNVLPTL